MTFIFLEQERSDFVPRETHRAWRCTMPCGGLTLRARIERSSVFYIWEEENCGSLRLAKF